MLRLSIPTIGAQEIKAVSDVLKTGFLVQGKKVAEFEDRICDYLGVKHAVAVSSGTSALHLALIAAGVGQGDEVIIPDYTFPATANVVELTGAKPILVDIDPRTFNIDPQKTEAAITKRTKALMPVHLFGQSADMTPLLKISRKHRITVIEDAACALGSTYKNRKCGTLGDMGCFSFHPRKITTTGEGGMIVTPHKNIAARLRILRNHGIQYDHGKIDFIEAGYNYRLTDFQAAMGIIQLSKLDHLIKGRQKIADEYAKQLKSIDWVEVPAIDKNNNHIYQSYTVKIKSPVSRDHLLKHLRDNGVEANIGTYAIHQLTFYKRKYRLTRRMFPTAESISSALLSLPLYDNLPPNQIHKIVGIIKKLS